MSYDPTTGAAQTKWATPKPPDWLSALCAGSTTDARTLTVVAEGKHLAVVKYPGSSYWSGIGGRNYGPVRYECIQKRPGLSHLRHVRELQALEGRQSKIALGVFCTAMRALDSRWEAREAERIAKERAKGEKKEAERQEENARRERDRTWLEHRDEVITAVNRAVPLLVRLGDFIANGEDRCEILLALRNAIGKAAGEWT